MSLINEKVEIVLGARNVKHFEARGYKIPKHKYRGKLVASVGETISVEAKDLTNGSNIKVKCKCDNCGNEYLMKYYHYVNINHDGKTYCKNCANTVLHTGENNSSWKADKTIEERENGRCYPEYTQFIKKVLVRDNYTCQCCGKKSSSDIQVHHLDAYSWCKEKRTDETNGITLCKNCHSNFHSLYGRGENTKIQFEKWIGHAIELLKYEGNLSSSRKIYCVEENRIYNSAKEFAKTMHIKNNADIYRVCDHVVKIRTQKRKLKSGEIKEYTWKQTYQTIKGKHIYWLDEYEQYKKVDKTI